MFGALDTALYCTLDTTDVHLRALQCFSDEALNQSISQLTGHTEGPHSEKNTLTLTH